MTPSHCCRRSPWLVVAALSSLASCKQDSGELGESDGIDIGDGDGDGDGSGDGDGDGDKLDIAAGGDGGGDCPPDDPDCEEECEIPEHVPCDGQTTNPFTAMGIACPGELEPDNMTLDGPAVAVGIRNGFGSTGEWDPTEGSVYAVLGSGLVAELDTPTPGGDSDALPTFCNDDLGPEFDKGTTLPPPLVAQNVGGTGCIDDPTLIGTGDCSNTIQEQFEAGSSANDYTELRLVTAVPEGVSSIAYDFAFFSVEYPWYFGSAFNDMYVGWLESEAWTGNISFDTQGNPISLNAGFLDFRDDGGGLPQLAGTCMARHAGTKWLSTTAGVVTGETITVVFAIFDLSDSILDSYVFLDNFQWGCEGEGPPETVPIG